MFLKLFFGAILALSVISASYAQTGLKDTLISIPELEVTTSRLKNFAIGTTIDRIESQVIQKNNSLLLTDIFSNYTGMAIKSYGLGGLSTISIRGAGAAHTAVLWNGLNIQSPMSGMANLSTIPALLVSDITIQQGGAGTLYGSGAVGGVIHISSFENIKEKNHVTFQVGIGSFNRNDQIFSAKTGDANYAFTLKIFRQSALNDFPFRNTFQPGNPKDRQTNAGYLGYGFMPDLQVKTSNNSSLNISALYQKYSKDIQTLMTLSFPSNDNQADDNLILTANWKYVTSKYTLNFKSGLIKNRILMIDKSMPEPEENPVSKNTSSSFINEVESKIFVRKNHSMNAGINYTLEKGESDGYLQSETRNRISLFSSYKITDLVDRLDVAFSLREEIEKNKIHPIIFSLGTDYSFSKKVSLKGNISRNYRIPAFNDLYWKFDGYSKGNPDLKAESGYSGEVGADEKLNAGPIAFELSQTVFASSVRNWIAWLPDNNFIWIPENKEREKTLGVELRGKAGFSEGNSKYTFAGFYNWTKAELTSYDVYNNQQMIYVPEHRMMVSADYSYKRFSADFNFNYVGKRYFYTNNSLPGYALGNIAFFYDIPFRDNLLKVSLRINNIWKTEYQSIAWYAMPLRSYLLSLNIRINTRY